MRTLAIALLIVAMPLAGCANQAEDPHEVTVAIPASRAPYAELADGAWRGFDVDVFREVAARSGWNVTFVATSPADILPTVARGDAEVGAGGLQVGQHGGNAVDFSRAYHENATEGGERLAFAVQRGDGALLSKIDLAIAGMKSDETIAQLVEKWGL